MKIEIRHGVLYVHAQTKTDRDDLNHWMQVNYIRDDTLARDSWKGRGLVINALMPVIPYVPPEPPAPPPEPKLSEAQARRLRSLIGQHTAAQVDAEMAGCHPPVEAQVIRGVAREAKKKLARYIRYLEGKENVYEADPGEGSLVD